CWEGRGCPVFINTVGSIFTVGQCFQRCINYTGSSKVGTIKSIMTNIGMVRGNVGRVGSDLHWSSKAYFLPAGCSLISKGSGGKQYSGTGPEVADVNTGIGCAFIKTDTCNITVYRGIELNAQFHGITIILCICCSWYYRIIPDTARCSFLKWGKSIS